MVRNTEINFALIHRRNTSLDTLNFVKDTLTKANLPGKWNMFEAEYDSSSEISALTLFHSKMADAEAVILFINKPKAVDDFTIERGQLGLALGAGKKVFVWRYSLDTLADEPLLKFCHVADNEAEFCDKIRGYMPRLHISKPTPELQVAKEPKLIEIFQPKYNPALAMDSIRHAGAEIDVRADMLNRSIYDENYFINEDNRRRFVNERMFENDRKEEVKQGSRVYPNLYVSPQSAPQSAPRLTPHDLHTQYAANQSVLHPTSNGSPNQTSQGYQASSHYNMGYIPINQRTQTQQSEQRPRRNRFQMPWCPD